MPLLLQVCDRTDPANIILYYYYTGTEPHPYGQYPDTVMLLIQAGVLLDAVDEAYGRTAAHWAAHYNQYELLDIVMVAGN